MRFLAKRESIFRTTSLPQIGAGLAIDPASIRIAQAYDTQVRVLVRNLDPALTIIIGFDASELNAANILVASTVTGIVFPILPLSRRAIIFGPRQDLFGGTVGGRARAAIAISHAFVSDLTP
jgi:hypothetical protein